MWPYYMWVSNLSAQLSKVGYTELATKAVRLYHCNSAGLQAVYNTVVNTRGGLDLMTIADMIENIGE